MDHISKDFDTVRYGLPVPKTIKNYVPVGLPTPGAYVAANAEILESGYLKAIEVYAETAGLVTFQVQFLNHYLENISIK